MNGSKEKSIDHNDGQHTTKHSTQRSVAPKLPQLKHKCAAARRSITMLQYCRLATPPEEEITALAPHDKKVALGTSRGTLWI